MHLEGGWGHQCVKQMEGTTLFGGKENLVSGKTGWIGWDSKRSQDLCHGRQWIHSSHLRRVSEEALLTWSLMESERQRP